MKRAALLAIVLVAALFVAGALIVYRHDRKGVYTRNTRWLIKSVADGVRLHYDAHEQLPTNLDEVVEGGQLTDFFGQPLEYRIQSTNPPLFSIRSTGITEGSNTYSFEINGTNLILIKVE